MANIKKKGKRILFPFSLCSPCFLQLFLFLNMHIFGTPFCYVSVAGSLAHQYRSSARHHTAESLKLWNPSIKSAGTTTAMWPRLSWWNIGIARYFAVLQWEQCQTPPRRASNCETLQLDGRNLIDKIYSPSGAVPSLRVEDNGNIRARTPVGRRPRDDSC